MPNNLTHLSVREVSLVDAPACQEVVDGKKVHRAVVAIWKRDLSAALWDSEGVAKDGKTYGGVSYPKSDFAYTPDDVPSHWKLRLTKSPGGSADAGIVGAAIAALGKGFRGNKVEIPAEALAGVKAKVRAAWKSANPDKGSEEMPNVLKGETMTLVEIEKKLSDQDVVLKSLTDERDLLKAETAVVLKMSKSQRKHYAAMDEDQRKAYMAADPEKRKAMMADCDEKKREKAAEDGMDEATKKEFRSAGPIRKLAMIEAAEKVIKAKGKKKDDEDPALEDEDEDDLEKRELVTKLETAQDAIAKHDTELKEIRKRERLLQFTERAETELANTPGDPVEKGEMLMTLADTLPGGENGASFKKVFDGMKGADEAYKGHFQEVGKGGSSIPSLSVFDAKVEEISKREKIDKPHAVEKAMLEHPELYLAYEKDQRALVGRY